MRKRKLFLSVRLILVLPFLIHLSCFSQTGDTHQQEKNPSNPPAFSFGADLVSRYIWRGKDYGNSPAIQPNISFSIAGLKIGAWGSYGVLYRKSYGNYSEFDPYVSYTWKWLTLGITDYFFPNEITPNDLNKYFNYSNKTTGHTFEACLTFNGPEKFPLQMYAGAFFYGADKGKDSLGVYGAGTRNNYSTYFEISYPFNVRGIGVKPFIGGIPFGSAWYGPYEGIVNTGLTLSKTVRVSNGFGIPFYSSIIANPQTQSVFFVFGLTL